MITTFNLFTSIAWIIAGITSAIISSLFLMKNPRKRLNQLFSAGFIFWSLSLVFNGISFAIAYRSLSLANIFRDLCVVTGIFTGVTLVLSAIGIYFGAETIRWYLYLLFGSIGTILSIFGAMNDWVVEDSLGGFKTTDNIYGKTCVQFIPAVLVIVGAIFLIITYFTLKNKLAKKRIGYFTIGFSTIILGLLMFVIDYLLNVSPYIFPTLAIISWVMGPILMLAGFYIKIETEPKAYPALGSDSNDLKTLDPKQKIERPS
ncbi:MAG: hypothetical protein FK734_18005 [Asgard group archaeon]|nr:hypothetical protein [Asgard group archaeon]